VTQVNRAHIRQRTDGRYDFDIVDAANGNILCSSSQGYESRSYAADMARRVLFGEGDPVLTFTDNPDQDKET
jgi:hypothetical protein